MCGRYAVFLDPAKFERSFGVEPPVGYETYNAAPSQSLPAVRERGESSDREAATPEWGFVPSWAGDDYSPNINARVETVRETSSFAEAYRERRCLVPASGFYEWREESGENRPYYFEREDGEPFAMAGIWSERVPETTQTGLGAFAGGGPSDPEPVETFAVLTRAATGTVADYHHRESVVVAPDDYGTWLSGDDPLDDVLAESASFRAHRVSSAVNDPGNDAPELTRPV
ncbi:SOS response-associated peptidase [Salarchaeum sp. JOR-1]|uniref:SOS response-associated peptidase n=1 Tax=Salarchaeum sp. JOR-1 TaxID=2599399 RepID=UPI001198B09F|nr:SOS response-associated peptidase [Salarchaeum sp. JOR-1]QDX39554.1 SOS response-associated peptidase [Salarchaeum sp. JOR-1]